MYFVPDVSGFDVLQQRASDIRGMPVVAMCETPFHGYRGLVKRLMDVTVATLALILLAPLLLGIAWAVRREFARAQCCSGSAVTVSMAARSWSTNSARMTSD